MMKTPQCPQERSGWSYIYLQTAPYKKCMEIRPEKDWYNLKESVSWLQCLLAGLLACFAVLGMESRASRLWPSYMPLMHSLLLDGSRQKWNCCILFLFLNLRLSLCMPLWVSFCLSYSCSWSLYFMLSVCLKRLPLSPLEILLGWRYTEGRAHWLISSRLSGFHKNFLKPNQMKGNP